MATRKKAAKKGRKASGKEEEIEASEEAVKPQAEESEEKGAVKSGKEESGDEKGSEEKGVNPSGETPEGEEGGSKPEKDKKKRKRKDEEDNDTDYVVDANSSPKKRKGETKEKKPVSPEDQKMGEEIKRLRAVVTGCGSRIPRMKPGTPFPEKLEAVKAFMKEQNISATMTKKEMLAYKAEAQKKKDLDLASLNPKKILSMKSRTSRAKKRKNYKDPGSEEEVASSDEASEEGSKEVTYKYIEDAREIQEDLKIEVQEEVDGEEGALAWFGATAVREFTKDPGVWRLKYADGTRGNVKFEKGKWRVAVN